MDRRILPVLFALILLGAMPLCAIDWIGVDVGMLLLLNSEEDSAPSPLLTHFGATLPIPVLNDPLYWESSALFFWTYYLYTGTRPSPAEF